MGRSRLSCSLMERKQLPPLEASENKHIDGIADIAYSATEMQLLCNEKRDLLNEKRDPRCSANDIGIDGIRAS